MWKTYPQKLWKTDRRVKILWRAWKSYPHERKFSKWADLKCYIDEWMWKTRDV